MIILNLNYSLGNQMFEYAYAKALSISYNEKIVINEFPVALINWGDTLLKNKKITTIHYPTSRLKNLSIEENVRYMSLPEGVIKGIVSVFKLFFLRKLHGGYLLRGQKNYLILSRKGFYSSDDLLSYYVAYPCKKKKKELLGVFSSPKYFNEIESIIKMEFQVKTEASDENKKLINEIKGADSICVHIRRGDFFEYENTDLQVCTEIYYKKAMKYIKNKVNNPQFYIFSNTTKDIDWIKQNFKFEYPVKYVELNNPDYEELRLMYNCKHFIISNSTFSWWAAFLAENPQKIILAPNEWRKGYEASLDCFTPNMILINIDVEKKLI